MTREGKNAVVHGVMLSVLCVISYWLITHILAQACSVSHEDDLLRGTWAVVAAIVVYRCGYEQSVNAALSRMTATLLSFLLCCVYMLFFRSKFGEWPH